MNNETGLDWLARNVHVWPNLPCGKPFPAVLAADGHISWLEHRPHDWDGCYDKHQWLDRRAELQNRPSWDEVPSEAQYMTQGSGGAWGCWSDKPAPVKEKNESGDTVEYWGGNNPLSSFNMANKRIGEVLGDWRDTLEKRPEQKAFEPFTSIEDNQEQDMAQQQEVKQDNGWFERGELPPVGTVCLYVVSDRLSAEVEITAHAKLGLCFVQVGQSGESYVSKTAELHRFRPVRTERDVLLSIIVEEMNRYDTDGKLADAILAAGFKRGEA